MIMPYDKIDQITYLFYFNIVDVTLRYKASISIDKGPEFKSDCEKLLRKHGVKIQKAKSKPTIGIVKRVWMKNLLIVIEYINNSIICQFDISSAMAIEKEKAFIKSSSPYNGPIGFNKEKLSSDIYSFDNNDYMIKHPERSFIREELMPILLDTELPSNLVYSILCNHL
ncbi:hypothetical protein RIR_jg29917.t1 [Rhizophagus irregularis DAOM 181602=DAOM 197198]|nr:hypothetical protein RIR_jg29917.t1 [Rhizophagus irregularis DAOM 181602=DAOM 197198]